MKSQEIAKIAGVSRSTVSRVINNYPNVPEATRVKVMRVIEEYNYSPNAYARSLAGKKSNTIGLFLFIDGVKEEDHLSKNDFFGAYMDLLVDYAAAKDYYVLVSILSNKSMYGKIRQAFMEKRIDGGIIIGTQKDTLNAIHLHQIQEPLVVFDYDCNEALKSRISTINSDDNQGIREMVRYLASKGHNKIGFIKGREASRSGAIRLKAYEAEMAACGLKIHQAHILEGDFSVEAAYTATQQMIQAGDLPTAMISANDYMALSTIKALEEAGITVPKDVSIIGFDNTLHGQMAQTPLTTIGPDFSSMAREAVDLLDRQIQSGGTTSHLTYPVNFYERETCRSI